MELRHVADATRTVVVNRDGVQLSKRGEDDESMRPRRRITQALMHEGGRHHFQAEVRVEEGMKSTPICHAG